MSTDNDKQLSGLAFLQYMMSDRFKASAKRAMTSALDHEQLSTTHRQQRQLQRNAMLVEDVTTIQTAIERQPDNEAGQFAAICLQEMIDECAEHGVTNFGETPAF